MQKKAVSFDKNDSLRSQEVQDFLLKRKDLYEFKFKIDDFLSILIVILFDKISALSKAIFTNTKSMVSDSVAAYSNTAKSLFLDTTGENLANFLKTNSRQDAIAAHFERAVFEKSPGPLFDFFVMNCILTKDEEK